MSFLTYQCAIVTFSVFNVEKYCDIEILVKGQSRSLKGVSFNRLGIVSYECSVVTLSLRHTAFKILNFKHGITLKTGLGVRQGH